MICPVTWVLCPFTRQVLHSPTSTEVSGSSASQSNIRRSSGVLHKMGRKDCRRQKGPGHHKPYHKTWTHKGSKKLNQPSDFSMHDSLRLPVLTQTTDFSTDQSFSRTMNPDMVPSSSSVSDDTMALGGRSLK